MAPRRLKEVADAAPSYYEELVLIDPARPDKPRDVLNVVGCLRVLQRCLHDRALRRTKTNKVQPRWDPPAQYQDEHRAAHRIAFCLYN